MLGKNSSYRKKKEETKDKIKERSGKTKRSKRL
jgi:hypothetical protein